MKPQSFPRVSGKTGEAPEEGTQNRPGGRGAVRAQDGKIHLEQSRAWVGSLGQVPLCWQ